ncbi:Nicotinamidase-related amidase [Marininema mesophilum]|uniref:Nicotinamidase-related amidase n=1 Tax=Marininema mesophilum TaxID=1048340 RepID=A0A1H3A2R7_9BACL|nr:cysteine hydrolase [Marininema mesophilum]SDX23548.1 Nicotinamidase-related amidase [Marininema mesophilum]
MNERNALVLIDIQREYVTEGRPFYIRSIGPSLENAKTMLEKARTEGWMVVHVRHLQEGEIFNADSEFSDFVQGFEPRIGEREITKYKFSCFSSEEFSEMMDRLKEYRIHIVGYGSTMCCLSTIVEGYHRGHQMIFIHDASNAKEMDKFSEESHHAHATEIMATFADVATTQEISV